MKKAKKVKKLWMEIPNEDVVMVWQCSGEGCEVNEHINPNDLSEGGIPFCPDCEEDMVYVRTEVLI